MKITELLNRKNAEETFAALAVILLLILPMWGAIPMLVGSALGLVAYVVLFRERLRSRGWLKALVIPVAVAAVVGATLAAALS